LCACVKSGIPLRYAKRLGGVVRPLSVFEIGTAFRCCSNTTDTIDNTYVLPPATAQLSSGCAEGSAQGWWERRPCGRPPPLSEMAASPVSAVAPYIAAGSRISGGGEALSNIRAANTRNPSPLAVSIFSATMPFRISASRSRACRSKRSGWLLGTTRGDGDPDA